MGEIQLRGGHTTSDPRLDRLPQFDPRSRSFPIAAVVPETVRRGKTWYVRSWYDQGREGACVSFAWHHEASASPVVVKGFSFELIRDRYHEMQRRDEWAGGSYPGAAPFYEGTSVLAGAKLMHELGFFEEYRWAFTIDEVMRAIAHEGPVVLGIPWLNSMFSPRPSGLLDCSGQEIGGHAILARGLSLKPTLKGESKLGPVVRLHNSWGKDWGVNGDAFIKVEDLERLLADWGECCVPVGRKRPE